MACNRRFKLNKLALGGALIVGALFVLANIAFGYDQQNTHPALTDEAVDFYNLNFPEDPLTEEDKSMLIKGAVEEDTPVRWLNHFYDPIYNTGWLGYTSAKDWAYGSSLQIAFYAGANYGGFANLLGDNLHPQDYSYQRALYDYATGNRKRAMLAMGHVMHLLEDSNVPEHTRGDTHLPWHGTESPYEKDMAKWNPNNLDVASKLKNQNTPPILLRDLNSYFNQIANYSNKYFFSEDTILSEKYSFPEVVGTRLLDEVKLVALGLDKNKEQFGLAILNIRKVRNIVQISRASLIDEEWGTLILDDYWLRLSKDFVIHGAGALKLFLDQAEQVKRAYQEKYKIAENQNPNPIDRFFAFFGWERNQSTNPPFDTAFIDSIISQPAQQAVLSPNQSAQPLVAGESDTISDGANPVRTDGSNNGDIDTNDGGQVGNDGNSGGKSNNDGAPSLPTTPPSLNDGNLTRQASLASIAVGSGINRNDGAIETKEVEPPEEVQPQEAARAPTTILDLVVDPTSFFGNIKLTWSAPSDTDSQIASLSYDLRYATKSFDTISNWNSAIQLSSASLPAIVASAGQPESASFAIVDYNRTYYFAIKTTDGLSSTTSGSQEVVLEEHWSSISNQAEYTIKPAVSDWQANLTGPANPSISWQFQAPERFFINQPVVGQDGTICFGVSDNWINYFYAVTPDGLEKWQFSGLNGPPSTPAILDDSTAYFGQFDHGSGVTAVDRHGQKRWEFDVGDRVNSVAADEKGNVYFTSENKWVGAIGPKGEKKWQFLNDFTFGFTPLIIQKDAYKNDIFLAANNSGQPEFYKISRDDGSIIWQKRNSDSFIYSTFDPVYDPGTNTLYAPTTNSGQMLAVNPATGDISKKIFDGGAWPTTKATVVNDLLVVGVNLANYSPASGSAIYALELANPASIQWKFALESLSVSQIIKDRDNNLYFSTKSGKIYSITAEGSQRWVVDLGVSIDQYPVLGDGAVYVGAGGKLIKIGN